MKRCQHTMTFTLTVTKDIYFENGTPQDVLADAMSKHANATQEGIKIALGESSKTKITYIGSMIKEWESKA